MPRLLAMGAMYFKAHSKLGYVAQGLGDRDLKVVGVKGIKEMEAQGTVPVLCANLVDKAGQKPFKSYVVVEKAGMKIAVVGLISGGAEAKEGTEYRVEPAETALKEVVMELQQNQKPSAIVVLAHLEPPDIERVAKAVPGVDLYLGGQTMNRSTILTQYGEAWYAEGAQRGQVLNQVVLHMTSADRKPFVVREADTKLTQEVTRLDAQIKNQYSALKAPATGARSRGGSKVHMRARYDDLLKQRAALAEQAKSLKQADADAPFLSYSAAEIVKDFPDDPAVNEIITEFEKAYPSAQGGRVANPPARPIKPDALKGATQDPIKVIRRVPPETVKAVMPPTKAGQGSTSQPATTTPPPNSKLPVAPGKEPLVPSTK